MEKRWVEGRDGLIEGKSRWKKMDRGESGLMGGWVNERVG